MKRLLILAVLALPGFAVAATRLPIVYNAGQYQQLQSSDLLGGGTSIADGGDTALGTTTDPAYAGSGASTLIGTLKGLYAAAIALQTVQVQPVYGQAYAATNDAGTITLGNTFQTFLASNAGRHGCYIQNTSAHVMYVFVNDGVATKNTANSVTVAVAGYWSCGIGNAVITNEIDITTSTTSDTFAGYDY